MWLLVLFCADREVISYTADIMQIVSLYVLMEGFSVRSVFTAISIITYASFMLLTLESRHKSEQHHFPQGSVGC